MDIIELLKMYLHKLIKMNNSDTDKMSIEEMMEIFGHMLIEEFLMKKNIYPATLTAFRQEWARPSQNDTLMSWYEISSKLHLNTSTIDTNLRKSVLENVVEELIKDSSVRTRRSANTIVSSLLPSSAKTTNQIISTQSTNHLNLYPKVNERSPPIQLNDRQQIETSQNSRPTLVKPDFPVLKSNLKPRPVTAHSKLESTISLQISKHHDNSAKQKKSNQFWIPEKNRLESIHRSFQLAKENIFDLHIRELSLERLSHKHTFKSELDQAHAEEKLGVIKKIPCACCQQLYLPVNMPQSVSMKAIFDIRLLWSGDMKSKTLYHSIETPSSGKEEASKAVTQRYNQVRVCVFCAQFFQDQHAYRPTYDELVSLELRKKYQENVKREKEYWDPLKMCEKYKEALETENPTYISVKTVTFDKL